MNTILRGPDLRGADFSWADLSGADLSGADLRRANLRDAELDGAYLDGADLRRADLTGADLTGADLRWADLRRANLSGADLTGADLTGADLTGANITNDSNFTDVTVDNETIFGDNVGLAIGVNPTGVVYIGVDPVALRDDLVVVDVIDVCPICHEEGGPGVRTTCGHEFHASCLLDWKRTGRGDCPMCRREGSFFGTVRRTIYRN